MALKMNPLSSKWWKLRAVRSYDISNIGDVVIGLSIAIFLASALYPTAITNFFGANTTTWTTEASSMWEVSGLLAVVALAVAIVGVVMKRRG